MIPVVIVNRNMYEEITFWRISGMLFLQLARRKPAEKDEAVKMLASRNIIAVYKYQYACNCLHFIAS